MNKIPRRILITGASGDIGSAVAEKLASRGERLYLCGYRGEKRLQELATRLSGEYGILCSAHIADLRDPAAADTLFSEIAALDVLISCAGIAHFSLLQDTTEEDWHEVLDTNLTGSFHMIKRAVPLLLKSENARILNISSVWGSRGASMESAYSASNVGLDARTRSLARELAPGGIAVNAIACGVIDTRMNRSHLSEEDLDALKQEIPAGRFASPEEVSDLAALLLDAPSYLTGQIIGFDGGWKV